MKTVQQYGLRFGAAKYSSFLNFSTHADFYAVEQELLRTNDIDKAFWKSVFPDLHSISDASVASKLTTLIRKFVPNHLKNLYSSKSIRGSN